MDGIKIFALYPKKKPAGSVIADLDFSYVPDSGMPLVLQQSYVKGTERKRVTQGEVYGATSCRVKRAAFGYTRDGAPYVLTEPFELSYDVRVEVARLADAMYRERIAGQPPVQAGAATRPAARAAGAAAVAILILLGVCSQSFASSFDPGQYGFPSDAPAEIVMPSPPFLAGTVPISLVPVETTFFSGSPGYEFSDTSSDVVDVTYNSTLAAGELDYFAGSSGLYAEYALTISGDSFAVARTDDFGGSFGESFGGWSPPQFLTASGAAPAVPEPCSLGSLAVASLGLLLRRR